MVEKKAYTLAAVLIFTTLLMIGLTVVVQSWSNLTQREREEELIFRGMQYVEAIRVFKTRNGRNPVRLKELIEYGPGKPRCIRKLYKDPITNSDKWGLIFQGNIKWPAIQPAQPQEGMPTTPLPPSSMEMKPLEGLAEGEPPQMPIIGVFSTSTKDSLRTFMGRKRYCDWEFSEMLLSLPGAGTIPVQMPGGNTNLKGLK
jgi:type II secretory pathway pseudopilin PulG